MESPRGVPVKTILKKCCTFTGECPWRNLISIKLLCSFKEITLPYGCFLVNLLHFFRTPFLWTPLDGCFWAFWATSRLLLFIRAPLEECFWNYIKKIKFRECQHFRNAVFQYFSIANNSYSVKSIHIWRFFWSVFSRIWIEYGDLLHKPPYSVRMRENTDQKKLRIWTLFTQWTWA